MADKGMSQDTRKTFVWLGRGDDLERLAILLANETIGVLFNIDRRLCLLQDGKFVQLDLRSMRDTVNAHVKMLTVVNRGTADNPKYEVDFTPFDFQPENDPEIAPSDKDLIGLTALVAPLVSRGPSRPTGVPMQVRREVRTRRQSGEPAERIAAAYGISAETVRLIEQTG
jgi:hypothetical protein